MSRFNVGPTDPAAKELKRLLNYMFHSADKVTLTYGGTRIKIPHIPSAKPPLSPTNIVPLHGLLTDHHGRLAQSSLTNNNYVGALVLMFNGAIDWGSTLLKVKLSTAEVEIAAG